MPAPLPDEVRERVLVALRAGATRSGAAAAVGIGTRTLFTWIADDEDYAASVEQAEAFFEAHATAQIRRAGEEAEVTEVFDGTGKLTRRIVKRDWRATAWVMEHHPKHKKDWRTVYKTETELTGPGGGPVQMAGVVFTPEPEWVADYLQALAELPVEVVAPMLGDGLEPSQVGTALVRAPARESADILILPTGEVPDRPDVLVPSQEVNVPVEGDIPSRGVRIRSSDLR